MNLLKIDILNDGTAQCERQVTGQIGEGNITRLKFSVPYIYTEYYKYLDILKGNGEKTQTVIGDTESEIFYYTLPHRLTDCRELYIQLIMKKEDKIFKSKMIALHFDGSISATQYLEENFQDTIEYLMENKADEKDVKSVESKLLLKAGKSELYELNESLTEKMNDHQEKNGIRLEGLEVITESLREKKVDKIYGKGLSSNDFTNEEKEKVAKIDDISKELKGKTSLNDVLNSSEFVSLNNRIGYINFGMYEENTMPQPKEFEGYPSGIYHIEWTDSYYGTQKGLVVICYCNAEINLILLHREHLYYSYIEAMGEWMKSTYSTHEINSLKNELKSDIDRLANEMNDANVHLESVIANANTNTNDIMDLYNKIGDINSALDELHNYAQALISGGA